MTRAALHIRAMRVLRRDGPVALARRGTRFAVTGLLSSVFGTPSRKVGVYNGVAVRNIPLLGREDVNLGHERQLIDAIRRYVPPGSDIVVVGGGSGPSTVVSARQAGNAGRVTVFEGTRRLTDTIEETARLNAVSDGIAIRHAIVGEPQALSGDPGDAEVVPPEDLPDCDALVLDCEGSERPIIDAMTIEPETVVVETHAHYDSPASLIAELLDERGYEVVSRQQRGETISVLVARRDGSDQRQ